MSEFSGEHGEGQDFKLTEQEIKLIAKLLSDPTYFPVEFRTWLKNYIESAGIQVSVSQIRGGSGAIVQLPAGIIIPYGGTVIASNVLPCDGVAVARSLYPALFTAIGTTWGAGDGSTTFNVPDFRDRALYGIGSRMGMGETDGRSLGDRGGPDHHHFFGQTTDGGGNHSHGGSAGGVGDHSHTLGPGQFMWGVGATAALGSGGSSRFLSSGVVNDTDGAGGHDHSISTDESGDHDHWVQGDTSGGYDGDRPSYAGVNYAITTGKGG